MVSPRPSGPCRSSSKSPRPWRDGAAPDAWIVDFTNPVGIVSQALIDAGHRAIGLCNVAINLQRGMAERFDVTPDRVRLEHVGLNHLSWERAVFVDDVDRLPELLASPTRMGSANTSACPANSSTPSGRSRPTTCTTTTRPERSSKTSARAGLAPRRSSTSNTTCSRCTATRAWPRSRPCSRIVAGRITAKPLPSSSRHCTTAPATSRSSTPGTTVRCPTWPMMTSSRSRPRSIATVPTHLPLAPLSADLRGLVQAVKAYEHLAIDAALSGDRDVALRALMANPLVADLDIAVRCWRSSSTPIGRSCLDSLTDPADQGASAGLPIHRFEPFARAFIHIGLDWNPPAISSPTMVRVGASSTGPPYPGRPAGPRDLGSRRRRASSGGTMIWPPPKIARTDEHGARPGGAPHRAGRGRHLRTRVPASRLEAAAPCCGRPMDRRSPTQRCRLLLRRSSDQAVA